MDKYDLLIVLSKIREIYKDRNNLYSKYLIIKKDWIIRYYYIIRMKKSTEYRKKNPLEMKNIIHKVGVLK